MNGIFNRASSFNQPLNHWDVSKVRSMENVLIRALAFIQPLDELNVKNVVSMFRMFSGAKQFKHNDSLILWNLEQVKDKREMFEDAVNFM